MGLAHGLHDNSLIIPFAFLSIRNCSISILLPSIMHRHSFAKYIMSALCQTSPIHSCLGPVLSAPLPDLLSSSIPASLTLCMYSVQTVFTCKQLLAEGHLESFLAKVTWVGSSQRYDRLRVQTFSIAGTRTTLRHIAILFQVKQFNNTQRKVLYYSLQ